VSRGLLLLFLCWSFEISNLNINFLFPYSLVPNAANGQVYSFGSNTYGQLGDGSWATQYSPVAVDTSGVLNGTTITAISAGYYHSLVLSGEFSSSLNPSIFCPLSPSRSFYFALPEFQTTAPCSRLEETSMDNSVMAQQPLDIPQLQLITLVC